MTFYEELGVPPDATLESIRDAYRKVARLLHPDVQTDPALKESAESQMKRINHLYGILSDPERRRRYDQELAASANRPSPIFLGAPPAEEQFGPRHGSTLVWLAATAICATFIIWLASRESSSMPAVYPLQLSASQPTVGQTTLSKSIVRPPTPATVPPPAVALRTQTVPQRDDELAALRGKLLAANSDREQLQKQMTVQGAERKPLQQASVLPAPLVAPQPSPDIALPVVLPPTAAPPVMPASEAPAPVARWAGSWSYHRASTGIRDNALIPPEFIEAVITEDKGRIRGQYHARFKVADSSISPDVDFHFEGKVSGQVGHLTWTGTGGAKGEVQLHLVSAATLEIVWSATNLGKSMGLESGTALLSRKN